MSKQYTCEVCSETFIRNRSNRLVTVVKKHVEDEHSIDLEKDRIRKRVEPI